MNNYGIQQVEIEEYDQILDSGYRRLAQREAEQPRRSPIRRKDRWHQEEEMKPKTRRSHKKIQQRLKYDWQGE